MPHEIGTASGHYDLLAKIKAFVTSTVEMGAGNEWSIERDDTTGDDHELILNGPGLTGLEEIFVGIKTYQSVDDDYFNFKVMGATGYSLGDSFEAQPGSSGMKGVPLWDATIPYWIIANAQRIIVVANVETIYQTFYIGKMVPYARPNQYPYPLAIVSMLTSAPATRYSDTSYNFGFKNGDTGAFVIRDNAGTWLSPKTWPWKNAWIGAAYYTATASEEENLRDTGGVYPVLPIVIWETTPNHYGEFDGVYYVSGFSLAVEDTMTIGGDTYLVVRNAARTGFQDYIAIKLD